MDHAALVGGLERGSDLQRDANRFIRRERAACQSLREILS